MIEPITLTIEEACQRHKGISKDRMAQLCLTKKLRAQKVGRHWHISVADLDRVFLGAARKAV